MLLAALVWLVKTRTAAATTSFVDYCNAWPDLKNAFCSGNECTAAQYEACRDHCYRHGISEPRPVLNSCSGAISAQPQPVDLGVLTSGGSTLPHGHTPLEPPAEDDPPLLRLLAAGAPVGKARSSREGAPFLWSPTH